MSADGNNFGRPGIVHGLDERIARKSNHNFGIDHLAAKSNSIPGIVDGIDEKIASKSQRHLLPTANNEAAQPGVVEGMDQRILVKSRNAGNVHNTRRRSSNTELDPQEKMDLEEEEEELELDEDSDHGQKDESNEKSPLVNVVLSQPRASDEQLKVDKSIRAPLLNANEVTNDSKVVKNAAKQKISGVSMKSSKSIHKKKKRKDEVDTSEILRADFAFVDTYDSQKNSKLSLEDDDCEEDPMVYHNSTLLVACQDFFQRTGFVGLVIMTALICSIAIPMAKARTRAKIQADLYTTLPTSPPSGAEYFPIFNALREVTDVQTLVDEDSPQFKAFNWLVNWDPLRMTHQDPALVQRYALAVLYFATNGPRWFKKDGWLTKSDVCQWDHVTCGAADLITKEGIVTGLDFYRMGLSGTLPSEIGELVALKFLTLSDNKLSGTLPPELFHLFRLEKLHLNRNNFNGEISERIGALSQLQILSVSENELTGRIPQAIGRCSKLVELYLHTNKFTGKIPAHSSKLYNLEILDMAKNSFSGTLPRDMSNFAKLSFLELSFNNIVGTIPTEFGSMKTLKRLRLNFNELSGTLPTEIGALSDLRYLNLESNSEIKGSLPTEFGKLRKLVALDLGHCQLSGIIPSEMGKMESLQFLNIYNNQISGSMPTQLGRLVNLKESRFQFTNLQGEVPREVCALRTNNLLLLEADCPSDIVCDCCTRCSDLR